VLGLGVLGPAVDEHLDLVELVDPDDALGVLAVTAGLAAIAGRPPGIPLGAVGEVDDLVGVVAREGDLGGAGEVEVVGGQVVDLVGVVVEEARPAHDLGAHQGGVIIGVKPASTARATAILSRASSSRAPTPVRK
jgi:hypothetical protein